MLANKKGMELPDKMTELWFQDSKSTDYFNHNHQKQVCVQQFALHEQLCCSICRALISSGPHLPVLGQEDESPGPVEHRGVNNRESEITIWISYLTKKGGGRGRRGGQDGSGPLESPHRGFLLGCRLQTHASVAARFPRRLIWETCPSSSQNELSPPLAPQLILTWPDRAAALLPVPRFWGHEDRSARSTQYTALTQPTYAALCSKATNGPTLTTKQILSVPASQ